MRHLITTTHPDLVDLDLTQARVLPRQAARAICLDGERILLLYTERYHDYSIPGGGIDEGEEVIAAMIRELEEETGAQGIRNVQPFGVYEEFRPFYKDDFDVMHMHSYCYTCEVEPELGATSLESYEISNGMRPVWINIHEAIAHNEQTMAASPKKGLSIERETYLLRRVVAELI